MIIYHFFYKTTNLINDKYYYGVHSTKNLNDSYLGSGVALKRAISKYGRNNFKREILKFFDTRDEAFEYEASIITEKLITERLCYNSCEGGLGNAGKLIPSNETKSKMSEAKKKIWKTKGHPRSGKKYGPHSLEWRENISKANKGKAWPKVKCINCGKETTIQMISRWHNDNCKTIRQ